MISRDDSGSVAVLRMHHGKVSALDLEFCAALQRELEAASSSAARALVITGTGSTFSAGVDLFRVLEGGEEYLQRFLPALASLLEALLRLPKPVVAAVNGHAIAGGCIIAAASDHRVMADGSGRIGVPELSVGVPFPTLPFEIMRARLSSSALHTLVYSGRVVQAREALELGLVDEVVDGAALLDRARAAAERLAALPAISFALTKRTFVQPILDRVRAAVAINDEVTAAWRSEEVRARMRAYVAQTIGKK